MLPTVTARVEHRADDKLLQVVVNPARTPATEGRVLRQHARKTDWLYDHRRARSSARSGSIRRACGGRSTRSTARTAI
jgi:hypothetical protein